MNALLPFVILGITASAPTRAGASRNVPRGAQKYVGNAYGSSLTGATTGRARSAKAAADSPLAATSAAPKVAATTAIYPHEPKKQWTESLAILGRLCKEHKVELIAIGNGTASRETDKLASELIALAPELKIIAPWREWTLKSREDCLDYAEAHGIPVAQSREKIHSRDRNLWHISHEGGELEDAGNAPLPTTWQITRSPQEAPDKEEKVSIGFVNGVPVSVNGMKMDPVSLVELVTAMLIVGILTAIAVPSYTSYMRKTRRTDAKVELMRTAQQFERCYTRYYDYTNAGCAVTLPYDTAKGTYTIDADAAGVPTPGITASTFAIKATPIGKQALDTQCGTFTLNQGNVQGVSGGGGVPNCW